MTVARRPLLPWLVWGIAVLSYAVAVINRSSLSALGPAAQEHFDIDATTLASFAVIQLLVYAIMQIPVGVLVDRFGASLLILSGGLLMVVGQLAMATVHDVTLAILARVLVGAGDACTFISVMRMLPEWFAIRQLPIVGQFTGLIGQAGQLVSVTPLALVVGAFGWVTGFVGVAAVSLLMVLVSFFVLRDYPGQGTPFERAFGRLGRTSYQAVSLGAADTTGILAAVAPPATTMMPKVQKPSRKRMPGISFWQNTQRLLALPGVRLAYWIHFTAPFAVTTFVLLWGTPYLTGGLGLSQTAAGTLLSLTIVALMVGGVLLGPLSSRFAEKRVWIVVVVIALIMLNWSVVLLWPGRPPLWLLSILMIVIALGGPASMIAFEVSRSHTPRSFAGFGTGLVNTGGFTSALLVIYFIGLMLDLQGAGLPENYSQDAFDWAFAAQIPFWVLGLTMILIEKSKTQRWMSKHERTLR